MNEKLHKNNLYFAVIMRGVMKQEADTFVCYYVYFRKSAIENCNLQRTNRHIATTLKTFLLSLYINTNYSSKLAKKLTVGVEYAVLIVIRISCNGTVLIQVNI